MPFLGLRMKDFDLMQVFHYIRFFYEFVVLNILSVCYVKDHLKTMIGAVTFDGSKFFLGLLS